jgi:transposase
VEGDKTFRAYAPDQLLLLPPSLADWLPDDHLARFLDEVVERVLDLGAIYAAYEEVRGGPPYDPRLMLKVLLYGYATGVRSSRRLERHCLEAVAFRLLAANQQPDFRSLARFRRRHLGALEALFVQTVRVCATAGLVKLGRIAIDGTKLRANASRHKAMSYGRMVERERQLQAEIVAWRRQIAEMLAEAEQVDAAEDARFGADRRGDELPAELARRESRLARIQAAKAALEAEAAAAAADAPADRDASGARPPSSPAAGASRDRVPRTTPTARAQRNFTDPDSKIMRTADKAFHQCYNGQAAVDARCQVIVAATLSNQAADAPHLPALLGQVSANAGRLARQTLADAGYYSEDNLTSISGAGSDPLIATGRLKHSDPVPPAPRGRIPKGATVKQRMARKLRTQRGRAAYARRKAIVEPVFGQLRTVQQGGQLLLRGLQAARAEWWLHCACHNLLKLFRNGGTARLALA